MTIKLLQHSNGAALPILKGPHKQPDEIAGSVLQMPRGPEHDVT
jgi:hypothetical protein